MQLYNYLITENHGLIIMLISLALLYLIIIIYGWCNKQKLSQRWLSGKYYGLQVLGALLKSHSSHIRRSLFAASEYIDKSIGYRYVLYYLWHNRIYHSQLEQAI